MDINEFVRRLDAIQQDYPFEAEKALKSGAREMAKRVKEASPDSGRDHKGKIKKSWRLKMAGLSIDNIQANIYSTSPYFHLVERGHVMKNEHGKVKGYRQGTHFFERAVKQNISEVQEHIAERLFRAVGKKL